MLKYWNRSLTLNKSQVHEDDLTVKFLKKIDVIINPPKNLKIPENQKKLIVNLKADPTHARLHDINAMALSGLLKIALNSNDQMPFLPFGGIIFSYHIALNILASFYELKDKQLYYKDLYLTEPLNSLKSHLFPHKLDSKQKKYLHNGLYPCYNVFKTKDDHWLVNGALEKKYFKSLLSLLSLDSSIDQRFNQDFLPVLKKRVSELTYKELKHLLGDQQICVTLLTKD